jgi:hypothetical protein
MAIDNNIKNFTATDIEKYHRGLLSNKEMHDLEKAAMDDPFLADALEGYAVAGVNAGTHIADLQKRVAERVSTAKVVVINASPQSSFRVLRAAVLVAFVAGASLLIFQFGFNKKSAQIASAETASKEDKKINDTAINSTIVPVGTTTTEKPVSETSAENLKKELAIKSSPTEINDIELAPGAGKDIINNPSKVTSNATADDGVEDKPLIKGEIAPIPAPAPIKSTNEKADNYKISDKTADRKDIEKEETLKTFSLKSKKRDANDLGLITKEKEAAQNNRDAASSPKLNQQGFSNQTTNLFRGRVTDADNKGVPFAKVINVQDNNAGTYTDPNGNFNLIYPDTVLTVQVRSIGFDNTNVQLRNNVITNQVIMQEDRKSLSEVVVSNQKPIVTNNSRAANIKLEEPEPADGWENYDTYVANNLEVPEDVKTKQAGTGSVEVSFEVNKNGQPINIKVEKSLCPKCDAEAKRLIKEGPKWKQNAAKKGKTTVTISF